jgi:hypothetical protein
MSFNSLISAAAGSFAGSCRAIGNFWVLAILLLTFSSAAVAQTFTYAPINISGAVATEARGINNNGEVVGFYYTTKSCAEPAGEVQFPNCQVHGFKIVNGTVVKLMVPNSLSTAIMGVNDYGDLVGFCITSDGYTHGFLWLHTNVVKLLNAPAGGPNSDEHTVAFGVNKALTIAGGLWTYSAPYGDAGWVWQNGTFSNMNPGSNSGIGVSVNGISNNGHLSGTTIYHNFTSAWFKSATDEDFYPLTTNTDGTAVNNNSDVIGYFPGGKGWFAKHVEANEGTNDAVEVKPAFISVAYPNAKATYPMGMNDSRWIAGTYTDSSGVMHGFIARPNF